MQVHSRSVSSVGSATASRMGRFVSARVPSTREALLRALAIGAGMLAIAGGIAGCGGGGSVAIADSQAPDPATVDYPVFYVKRTIPKNADDLRMMRNAFPKADLFKRATASPSATETNITTRITGTDSYDVKDVDVSADGKTVVFAMRGPLKTNMKQKDAPSWRNLSPAMA